jgi:16S rRNA A1518/A1519 N6-dimethyltransferase RsmA/KsgA/DIM1 with predicted DNA glycosylase/AP lyase activity
MQWLVLGLAILVIVFGFVVFFGPPYVPTLDKQINAALDLLDLSPTQTMLELGSGDGRVLKAAAKRGWNVVGYELNPILVLISWLVTIRYRKQVRLVCGNFWTKKWPPAEGIFIFMIGRQMKKIDKRIESLSNRPIKLASFAFKIPNKRPTKQRKGIYLYEYR